MNSSVGSPRVTRGAALRNHARRARRQRGAVPSEPDVRAPSDASLFSGDRCGPVGVFGEVKRGPREIGFRGKSDSSDSFHGRSKNAACTKKTHVGAAPRLPPPPLSPLSRNLRRVSARRTRAYRAIGHRCVSASPAESLSPSPSSSSSAALFAAAAAAAAAAATRARAPRRARRTSRFSRGEPRCRVAARGTAPAHLEPRAYAPGVERVRACHDAHVLSCAPSRAQHTRHAAVSPSSPKRDAQSPSPAIHRGSDVIVALDAGPGGSSQVASSTPASAVGDAAARIAASSPVVRRLARREHRLAFAVDGVARSRFASRGFARTPLSALSRFDAAPAPASVAIGDESGVERVGARAAAAAATRNTTGRSMNRNTVTVLAAPLAEEAEDEDEDTRGLS